MYSELPIDFYSSFSTNKEVILFTLVIFIILLLVFIGYISTYTKLNLSLMHDVKVYQTLQQNEIPTKESETYLEDKIITTSKEMSIYKFGLIFISILIIVCSYQAFMFYNEPKINTYITEINQQLASDFDEKELTVYYDSDSKRIDVFKINNQFYKKVNNQYIEIEQPTNLKIIKEL